ncbi:hypothetical protein Tco_1044370 [Tanacetum coccineum]|uniref:Uncharacterized protein n=1 Tax=Tanacetum coccineum TaxID=301880 RepID=A0ABQ5GPQ4_9ASTR
MIITNPCFSAKAAWDPIETYLQKTKGHVSFALKGQQPVQHNNTMGLRPNAPPGFQQTQPHQPTFGFNGHQQALYSAAVQNHSAPRESD